MTPVLKAMLHIGGTLAVILLAKLVYENLNSAISGKGKRDVSAVFDQKTNRVVAHIFHSQKAG